MLDEPRICPKCRQEVPKGPECPRCGILVDKAKEIVDDRLAARRLAPVVFSKPSRMGRNILLGAAFLLTVLGWFWIHRTVPPPEILKPASDSKESQPLANERVRSAFPDAPAYSSGAWHQGAYGYETGLAEQASELAKAMKPKP